MKSEKARQELEDGSWKVEVDCEGEEFDLPYHAVRVDVAQYAVEHAEQVQRSGCGRRQSRRFAILLWNIIAKKLYALNEINAMQAV